MAGQLNIKLLVASVCNLTILLIFFNFILLIPWLLQFSGARILFKKCLFPMKKFSVHVVISILQAVSNQIADSHIAPSLNRGISWPWCHNAPHAIMPPNMKLSFSLSEIQHVHASSHLNLLKYQCV